MTARQKYWMEHTLVAVTLMVAGSFFASPFVLVAGALIAQ